MGKIKCFFLLLLFGGMQLALAQSITVKGVVSDGGGIPLPGVNVVQKGTSNGTFTDFDGNYTIDVPSGAVLVFTSVGFAEQEATVSGTTLNVTMAEDAEMLGEVVVTGLGITREKKALGYATSTIKAEEIVETQAPNFAQALYGKAPGVRIAATPGGSTSATNITIRGINTITGNSQPLIILDGVPIRDGEVTNTNYWGDQRIRGNGLLDINPEDIENLSILKGASAAALYGSEAVNGVILITTKSGKGSAGKIRVDINSSYSVDNVAYLPNYQNVRGPGYPVTLADAGQTDEKFLYYDTDGDGVAETRGLIGTNVNYGPKFDGQPVLSWDGQIRPYNAQPTIENIFKPAHNSRVNVAVSNSGERHNVRFSYTRQDNQGISRGAQDDRNVVNLNTSFQWSDNITTDVMVNYINQTVTNRPYKIDRMVNNFGGMITRFDNPAWYEDKYQTSLGYRFVTGSGDSFTPDENIIYPGYKADVLDYYWRVNKFNNVEQMNRVIGVVTTNWEILPGLNLRGRASMDYTNRKITNESATTRPLVYGPSGGFSLGNNNYTVSYGDLLLSYMKNITEDLTVTARVGYNATERTTTNLSRGTAGGLSVENWFDIAASTNVPNSGSSRQNFVTDALLGTLNFDYKGMLFLEGTVRRDRTSTMNPKNNAFTYPSVNGSFVISEAFAMPTWINYLKVRGSWGVVGSYPDPYRANVAYNQNTMGSQGGDPVLYQTIPGSMGNDGIRPEEKREWETGLELRFFNNRLGIDASYYNAQIVDQILPLTLPGSSGANSVLTNIGTLRNQGFEFGINAVPLDFGGFMWDATLNFSKNINKVEALAPGLDELQHANWDGGAARMISEVGQPMGDIYAHPLLYHDNGEPIVDPNGLYAVDPDTWTKYGNAMPDWVGGFMNRFSYKNFFLDANMDFQIGGALMPTGMNWMIGRGLTEDSLKWMDAEHGGLSYYEDANGDRFLTNAGQGPNGELVYDDGIVLDGVKADGSPNDYIASNPEYFFNVYNWGGPQYSPNTRYSLYIKDNTYLKMREMSIGFNFPKELTNKIGINNLQLSVFGRNLFYIYRTFEHMDAEQTTAGSRWFQNVNNAGNNPSTRTYGLMVRASL